MSATDRFARPSRFARGKPATNWSLRLLGWCRQAFGLRRPKPGRPEPSSMLARLPREEADARPHLLVIVPWLPIGGAEVLLADILGGLKAAWRFGIVTTEPGDQALAPVFAALTREIYHLPDLLDRQDWLEFVVALLAARGSSAILSSGSRFLYANLDALKARFPALLSYDILHNDAPEGHLAEALGAGRDIDRFIAVSERIGHSLIRGGADAGAVAIIPNGVDYAGAFDPQRIDRQAARRRFAIEDGAFVIGFAGRMSEEKRPLAVLTIAAPILAAHPNACLLAVGDGPLAAAFDKAVRRAGLEHRVRRVPSLDRSAMPHFYAACSILVLPSRIEGTPLAMLEALAMGCPVAATDVGDIAIMIRDGANGFVTPVANPEALTPRIAGLVGDEAALERMRNAARQSILEAGRSAQAMTGAYATLMRPAG